MVEQRAKVEIACKCACCRKDFTSYANRAGERLCKDCVELRRALKGFLKRGLTGAEVMKRGKKLLAVKAKAE